jgi:preprotein translocase subunit SecF
LIKISQWHDRNYKLLLLIPLVLLLASLIYLGYFYQQNGDFFRKDISLTGGTSVTLNGEFNTEELSSNLQNQLESLTIRQVYDLVTREQEAVIIETTSDSETTKKAIEDYLGYELNQENSSFEFTGATLSQSFYKQLMIAILVAFLFMAVVVFIIFRTVIPSSAVIISAFTDILMTLALFNFLEFKLSSAGIVAFLMLIGYSIDTDLLLTVRVLKRKEGSLNSRLFSSFKTGITMTLTSLFAVLVVLIVVQSFSTVLTQIFTILAIGLSFDILNTWITNVSILKWYVNKK